MKSIFRHFSQPWLAEKIFLIYDTSLQVDISRNDVIFEDEGSISGLRDPLILIPRVILDREQFVRLKSD